jgi:hypothetical protein
MDFRVAALAGAAAVSGPVFFYRAFRDLRLRRLIQNTPTARMRSMPMGLVEVCGTVEPRSTVAAPFSGRPCAFWEVDIAVRGRRNSWTIVHRNASGQPFYVSDGTAAALVYPRGATSRLNFGVEEECNGITLPECYAQYMSDQRLAMRGLWRVGVMRFRERTLESGQRVYVLGSAAPRARALTISEGEEMAATGTDDRVAHRLRALDEATAGVIRQGENERTFILSQQSERELTLMLGLTGWAGLVGGPALTLFGLGYWLSFLSARMGR